MQYLKWSEILVNNRYLKAHRETLTCENLIRLKTREYGLDKNGKATVLASGKD